MDDILSYESTNSERDDCISPLFGCSTGSSETSVGLFIFLAGSVMC